MENVRFIVEVQPISIPDPCSVQTPSFHFYEKETGRFTYEQLLELANENDGLIIEG